MHFLLKVLRICMALAPFGTSGSYSLDLKGSDMSFLHQLNTILSEYLKFLGVYNVYLIVCPLNESGKIDEEYCKNNGDGSQSASMLDSLQLDVGQLTSHFMQQSFRLQIWSGEDYLDSLPPAPVYGPPNTFNTDIKRRSLKLHFNPLAYNAGFILTAFGGSCGLNVLRWCAAAEHNYFTINRFWVLPTFDDSELDSLEDKDIFLPPDSQVVALIAKFDHVSKFSLVDIYKISPPKILKRQYVATDITQVQQMITALRNYGSAISYREDLEGTTFNTGLVIAFPDVFTNIEDLALRHIDTISKVNNLLTLELAKKLNMKFNTHQTDNYGWHQPNGSFDGLMGSFQRYELDFGQMAIFMRLDRIALCDFVAETFRIRAGIMFRQPPLSAVANIFAMPFEGEVWISIIALISFTIFVFAVELLLSPHTPDMDFCDCGVFVWGAMCQQGFYVSVFNRSGRFIIFTTFVATFFLYTSFSANIVALLQSPSEAIHTISDLSQSPLEIGVQDTVYNKIYFNESTDPVTNFLFHKKIAPKGESVYMRPSEGMEKLRTGLFAYQVELQAGYQIISDTFSEPEKCGLMELEPFQLPIIAIPTRKNFPYKELFRRQLRWQREIGLMNREERKWFPQKPKCEGGVGGFVSIGITECRYALAMFGFGILFSLFALSIELMMKHSFKVRCYTVSVTV